MRVAGVSKTFAVPRHHASTLKERLRQPIASFGHDRLEALRDISFEVDAGEFFAVIGRNGSGKSTLLRCIAGIYEPDSGEVEVHGRLAPFIELGVGFHPVLNACDNVSVAGTLMGLSPREARRRVQRVIGFAELEEFADLKLANYSSGMQARLAFSTSIQVDADVLLFDEVLAVGDALFREKSFDTFERLITAGRTIVYVSHSLDTVRRFADRALLLERGRPVTMGNPDMVIEEYERRNRESARRGEERLDARDRYAEVVEAWFESEHGERTSVLRQGEHARFGFTVLMCRDMERPVMGFVVRDKGGQLVLSETDHRRRRGRERVRPGEHSEFSVRFANRLEPGAYEAAALLAPPDGAGLHELPGGAVPVRVEEGEPVAERFAGRRGPGTGTRRASPGARRFAEITLTLARTEFKLRYLDSVIGYVWALAQPLLMFLVLYAIVSQVVRFGAGVTEYPLKLLLGIVLFTFFTEAAGNALPSLVVKGAMLRKIPFPALALPLSSVLTSSFVNGCSLVIVVGFILAAGVAPSPAWLEMVPLLVLLLALTGGVSLLLSLVYLSVRDVQPIWAVITRLLFFATPVFFPIEVVPQALQRLLMLNPLAVVIVQARHALIDPSAPTAAAAAGGTLWLSLPVAATFALLGAGVWLFHTRGRTIAERI
jgi:ABC-type polysaccharide/polyol phosphate transport system ATPase subunit/ABC-type polysaccharide/polyol phosphate export permease